MVIKILGNWDFTPKACGNKDMVVTFKRLSGKDELEINRSSDINDVPVRRFEASIAGIKNPFKLEFQDGSKRDMTVVDIYSLPELADLYYELIVAYSEGTAVTGESVKKRARHSISR